jgi:hypothetical protein
MSRNDKIVKVLSDKKWHTLEDLSTAMPEYSAASISAGFRELKRSGIKTQSRIRGVMGRHPVWEYGLKGAYGKARPVQPQRVHDTLKAIRGIRRSIALLEKTLS